MSTKSKRYRIYAEYTKYSKRKGSYSCRRIVEKDIESLEEALKISKNKYGNKISELKWSTFGFIYPIRYEIK